MNLNGLNIGFALTGSFCTFAATAPEVEKLVSMGANVTPIFSFNAASIDTRFGKAQDWINKMEEITGNKAILSIAGAEPIGPKNLLDILVIAPCTGNTIAKLANAITDTPVLMAAKAHIRNEKPVVVAVSTNDGLSMNARNIGALLNCKNYYFVPFGMDNPVTKRNSLVAKMDLLVPAVEMALEGKQLQPVLIENF